MASRYVQPTFYDEAIDPTDLFPPAQPLGADCLSDDIASYFSFDDTINGSGATTPNYYPPSSHDSEVADQADEDEAEMDDEEEQREVKATAVEAPVKAEATKRAKGSSNKPKRKYSASVSEEMAEATMAVTATPAAPAAQVVETKASKRAKKLAQIDVAAAVSMPPSPFSLSPSFSSGSVSPAPSFSSASSSHRSSPSPGSNSGTSSLPVGDVDVGALLAESALKKSRLARKAELARLGRKRKNETIDKYSQQVDRLQAEMRQLKAQMEKERKAHKRALKTVTELNKAKGGASSDSGDEVMVKLEQHSTTTTVAAVKQPTDDVMAASQATLVALTAFCKQRDIDATTTTAACSALLAHMHSMAVSHTTVDGYRVALQRAAVAADSVAALVARFFASYSLQWGGAAAGGGAADVTAVWQAMWQQPRGQVTEQQVDELNAWMKTVMD